MTSLEQYSICAEKYAEAWRQYNSYILEDYLAIDFCYTSFWVFAEIRGRNEYLSYFHKKLIQNRLSKIEFNVNISISKRTGYPFLIINQLGQEAAISFKCENGLITSATMCPVEFA